jgi:uncharacterized protein YndB with AHSA1/START domain
MSTATMPLVSDAAPGEVTVTGDNLQVVFRRRLRAPVPKVWAALTVSERLADWFTTATIDLREGGTIDVGWTSFRITVCDPPRSLVWVWELGGRETLVRFDLAPEGDGCLLILTHSGLDPNGGPGAGVRAGWHAHLEGLPDALEGRATPSEVKLAREAALGALYPELPV